MKVLHVIPSVATVRGGPSQAVLEMVKALREQGVEAEIATTNDNGAEVLDVPLGQKIDYQQVPVWFFPRFYLPLKEFIFSGALTSWLWQHTSNYDLLHNHYLFSYATTCAGVIARYYKTPYLIRTIGQLTPWALAQSRFKKQLYSALIERHNLNQAAAIHCTSKSEADDVQQFGVRAPVLTMPLGVNQPISYTYAKQKVRNLYAIAPQIPIILFLSRLHSKKRPDLLLRSLAQVASQKQPFHLILAGSGEPEYVDSLKHLVGHLNLTAQVSFAGFVTGDDKQILLQEADIFVLPSFSENFGISVAEAMAAGLPVIVTPGVQIAPTIAQYEAGVVVEGDVDALSHALIQVLASSELRQQMGRNGQHLVQSHYSWEAIARHLGTVYESILSQKYLDDR